MNTSSPDMHVLIVDDHPLYIKGVQALLFELDPAIDVAGARSVEEALLVAQARPPDLMLLDLKLPGMNDLDALIRVKQALPSMPVVVVSANENPRHIWKAIELGAAGYIPKDTDQSLMIHALQLVLARGVYLPPNLLKGDLPIGAATQQATSERASTPAFSERQIAVLQALLQGKSNKVIARDLGIAEGTVKAHLWSIYQALGVSSRLQAMSRAHELRLVDSFPKLG